MTTVQHILNEIKGSSECVNVQIQMGSMGRDDIDNVKKNMCKSMCAMVNTMQRIGSMEAVPLMHAINDSCFSSEGKQSLVRALQAKLDSFAMTPPLTLSSGDKQTFKTATAHLNYFTQGDWALFTHEDHDPDSDVVTAAVVGRLTGGGMSKPSEICVGDLVTSLWACRQGESDPGRQLRHVQKLKAAFAECSTCLHLPVIKIYPVDPSSLSPEHHSAMYKEGESPTTADIPMWSLKRSKVPCRKSNKLVREAASASGNVVGGGGSRAIGDRDQKRMTVDFSNIFQCASQLGLRPDQLAEIAGVLTNKSPAADRNNSGGDGCRITFPSSNPGTSAPSGTEHRGASGSTPALTNGGRNGGNTPAGNDTPALTDGSVSDHPGSQRPPDGKQLAIADGAMAALLGHLPPTSLPSKKSPDESELAEARADVDRMEQHHMEIAKRANGGAAAPPKPTKAAALPTKVLKRPAAVQTPSGQRPKMPKLTESQTVLWKRGKASWSQSKNGWRVWPNKEVVSQERLCKGRTSESWDQVLALLDTK